MKSILMCPWATLFVLAILTVPPCTADTVLLEAESLADLGGWVIDQQSMGVMGSPYILAHGLGTPVADASAMIDLPAAGTYHVWVRTRDWVAPWNAPAAPGRFQLIIDDKALSTIFGVEGADWHWQSGGTVKIARKQIRLALRDLTGFDGRCDAVLLTTDADLIPPHGGEELAALRQKLLNIPQTNAGRYDLVVVGGGMAGTCTAISAARLGLSVALIQDRPVLGGNNSSEVRVHLNGEINLPPYPALGDVVRELDSGFRGNAQPARNYDDEKKLRVVRAEDNIDLFLSTHAFKVETDAGRITAIIAVDIPTGRRLRFTAPLFADCTGDATIGYLAGADYRMGRESQSETGETLAPEEPDRMTMGMSVQWYSVETPEPSPFPDLPWAMQFNEQNCQPVLRGDWDWEAGMNRNQVTEAEFVRDHSLRVIFGNWAYMKNHSTKQAEYANRKLDWVAYVGGKRESRRLMGDLVLCQQDIQQQTIFPDAFVTATWSIDLHYPNPLNSKYFPEQEFRSIAEFGKKQPYPVPYRCLYSRNVPNLMMAGRNISVTHVALGTTRVMRTCGMMGELLGMAASLCKKYETTPRGVYEEHLDELKGLATKGVGKLPQKDVGVTPPEWLRNAGTNLAVNAEIAVSSTLDDKYAPARINDGKIDIRNNDTRWVSERTMPQWVEFKWKEAQSISAARVVSGWTQGAGRTPEDVVSDFAFQYHDDGGWKDVPCAKVVGNSTYDWHGTFEAVLTRAIRLNISGGGGDTARLWEVELYDWKDAALPDPSGVQVRCDYPGGNIIVEKILGETVYLRQDLRDTAGWWFYWNFEVTGAAGRTTAFQFTDGNPIGVLGPAVSTDGGGSWRWLGAEAASGSSFGYTFGQNEEKARFCFAIPYQLADFGRFCAERTPSDHFRLIRLCESRKGRAVPAGRVGELEGGPLYRIVVTVRHHACESSASYALEGLIDTVLSDTDTGRWLRENVEVLAVPFVDLDGVEDGDQGKNRIPRDHNRDYLGESIYPEVRAIRDFVPEWSGGKLLVALDLHCPWIRGDYNEVIYMVGSSDPAVWKEQCAFGEILERVQEGTLIYRAADNLPFGKAWNTGANYDAGKSFGRWAGELEGVVLSTAIEIPYARANGGTVTAEGARAFGRDLAVALCRYLKNRE